MLNEHKHTNGENKGGFITPSSPVTPVTFFSAALLPARELCYEVCVGPKLVDLIRRLIF